MDIKKQIEKVLMKEFMEPGATAPVPAQVAPAPKKATTVKFNPGQANEFVAKFTERGFAIDDTRLNFDLLHLAISKRFTITLENGLALDNVSMQKILNYQHQL